MTATFYTATIPLPEPVTIYVPTGPRPRVNGLPDLTLPPGG
jgi:hypothetical protein